MDIYIFAAGKCSRMGGHPKWLLPLDSEMCTLDVVLAQCEEIGLTPIVVQDLGRPIMRSEYEVLCGARGIKVDYPLAAWDGVRRGRGRPFLLTCGDLIVSTSILQHFAVGHGTLLAVDTSTEGSYAFFGKTLVGLMRIEPLSPWPKTVEIRGYYDIDTPRVLAQARKGYKAAVNASLDGGMPMQYGRADND